MDGQARVNIYLELKGRLKGGLDAAKKHLNQTVQDMKGKLNELKAKHIEAFRSMSEEIPAFGRAARLIGNPFVLILAGLTAMIGLTSKAMALNRTWEEGMAKVNVTAQLNREQLHALDRQVDAIARRNTVPFETVPEAFNKIISAGLNVNDALKALEPTLRASKAGFTDVETTAAAAVSVMNSSGLKDTTKVYDVLFATLNKGNAEFKDIANYLPKIIPNARNVGVSLEEVAGAYAYMTAQGQTAEKAATLLENAFKVLGDPDKIKNFKKLGVSIYDNEGRMRSMISIAKELNGSLDGLTDKAKTERLAKLGLDTEAASAFAIMSQDVDKLKDSIDFTTNSAGQLDKAVMNSKTSMDGWKVIGNQFKSILNDIGAAANKWLGGIAEKLLPVITAEVDRFKEGTGVVYTLWSIISNTLGIVWEALSTVGRIVWQIVEPVFKVLEGIIDWVNKSGLLQGIFDVLKITIQVIENVVNGIVSAIKWTYDNIAKPIIDFFNSEPAFVTDMKDKAAREAGFKSFSDVEKAKDGGFKSAADYYASITPRKLAGTRITDDTPDNMPKNLYENKTKNTNSTTVVKTDGEKKGQSITGSQQVRNISIQKIVFVEGDPQFVSQQIGNKSPQELERWFTEMMGRMMVNVGRSYQ